MHVTKLPQLVDAVLIVLWRSLTLLTVATGTTLEENDILAVRTRQMSCLILMLIVSLTDERSVDRTRIRTFDSFLRSEKYVSCHTWIVSSMAQRKRAGPITLRSLDRDELLLVLFCFPSDQSL